MASDSKLIPPVYSAASSGLRPEASDLDPLKKGSSRRIKIPCTPLNGFILSLKAFLYQVENMNFWSTLFGIGDKAPKHQEFLWYSDRLKKSLKKPF